MKDQHTKIKGYRDLSQVEIDLMNEIKAKGVELEALLGKVRAHVEAQHEAAESDVEEPRLYAAQPFRWIDTAQTDLQTGLMALTRAVAQPSSF